MLNKAKDLRSDGGSRDELPNQMLYIQRNSLGKKNVNHITWHIDQTKKDLRYEMKEITELKRLFFKPNSV